jgi:DNA modification methylase
MDSGSEIIEDIPLGRLKPWNRNARTHSKKQVRQIADSITEFGFTNPVLIDESGTIIAGHGRVEAAKLLRMEAVPCLRIQSMTAEQKRAYVLADNKLALNAGWDEEILAIEIGTLLEGDIDFDIGITGFSIPEIDTIVGEFAPEEAADPREDAPPPIDDGPPISRQGDIWQLGPHRLICGDALVAETYEVLLAGEKAQMVFTDPPYNVPIAGHAGGSGAIQHPDFLMASGEMSSTEFAGFLRTTFGLLAQHSVDGAIHFVCMDWRHLTEILTAGSSKYSELKNMIVWVKDNGGMGSFYRSRHELVFAFKSGSAPHINSFELGQHGRYRTNVWEYRGANALGRESRNELMQHPTAKPVAMIADAIKDVSHRGGIVLDAFGGSGSTLIAAQKTGRKARLIELDPIYVDRIIKRWQIWAKDDAISAETGVRFDDLSEGSRQPGPQPDEKNG